MVLATGQFVMALDNSVMNVSIATALAGLIMIAVLTTSFLAGIQSNPSVPSEVTQTANTELAAGIPFISDADLEKAMQEAGQSQEVTEAVLDANRQARADGLDAAPAVLALITVVALFFATRVPKIPVTAAPVEAEGP
jgi:hypothetical protein